MEPKQAIRGLPVYEPGKPLDEVKRELGLKDVIKLASNENPFGCSPAVWKALTEERDALALYPEGDAPELRRELAIHLGVDEKGIVIGNGSDEVIRMVSRAYLEPGDEVVMADRTFPRYKTQTIIEDAIPVEVPLKEGVHHIEQMAARITERTKLVWICNPNNPTGSIMDQKALQAFLAQVPEQVMVVVDEAYHEYVIDSSYPDTISLMAQFPRLVVLRTFSKIYGLAAFRVGYGIAHPDIIRELTRVREPFNVNRLGATGCPCSTERSAICHLLPSAKPSRGKQDLSAVGCMGLFLFPHQGNFILLDTKQPAEEAFQFLLQQGVIVRSGQALGYPTYIRVTVGTAKQNQRFLRSFKNFCSRSKWRVFDCA